jgi:hypothetical protein
MSLDFWETDTRALAEAADAREVSRSDDRFGVAATSAPLAIPQDTR